VHSIIQLPKKIVLVVDFVSGVQIFSQMPVSESRARICTAEIALV
jgi:hypothetical protein